LAGGDDVYYGFIEEISELDYGALMVALFVASGFDSQGALH
jgi:hypothetical protein